MSSIQVILVFCMPTPKSSKTGENKQETYQTYTFSGIVIIEESNLTFIFGNQTY